MAKKQIKVIHISKRAQECECLSENFQYIWVPLTYDFESDVEDLQIFQKGIYNLKESNAVFIIEQYANIFQDLHLLKQLPAHRIVYPASAKFLKPISHVLTLKEAVPLDLTVFPEVEKFINQQFGTRQDGYKLNNSYLEISRSFKGEMCRQGNYYTRLKGNFGQEFQQVVKWRMTTMLQTDDKFELFPELEFVEGSVDIMFKAFLINNWTNEVLDVIEMNIDQTNLLKKFSIEANKGSAYLNISLFAKGEGEIKVGSIHLRRSLRENSLMTPGGKAIHDTNNLNGEIIHYFDAGDLKPPLAVYFSGYRSAEGFEGRRMMKSMGCPHMLIGDPRLEGGNFYLGDEAFEQKLVDLILEKVELLGFKKSDIILSGLSMGTFGALYYAADLEPHSVIVGKPLVNIGDIVLNGRINRPKEFHTALDMLYHTTGEISMESVQKLNQRFWDKFSKGNLENTTFAISYMKNDDYDKNAFPRLFDTLKEKHPKVRMLYKGFIGRHNDNSSEINQWFLKQYRNIMLNSFDRAPSDFR